jgi:TolB protein
VLLRPGGEPVPLTPGEAFDGWPSWSPDGSRILFASDRSGAFQVYDMDAHGRDVRRLVDLPGRYTNPRWSPAGDTIVFTGRRPGDGDVELLTIAAPTRAGDPVAPPR